MPDKRNEIIKSLINIEYYPTVVKKEEVCVDKYMKLPLAQITALGTTFEPLALAFKNIVNSGAGKAVNSGVNSGGSGWYHLTLPPGASLVESTSGSGFIGAIARGNNQVGGGMPILTQATGINPATSLSTTGINPLVCNPTTLFMAAALMSIDKKLDSIQETQIEIIEFLDQKEKSKQRGNLIFLTDVLNNYKHNWDNEKYKNSNHIKVLDIKQDSEQAIIFYREQINKQNKKQSFINSDRGVKEKLDKIQSELKEYQLALYLYSFSSFLEVLLLENYETAYLEGIVNKIEVYAINYRELYTECYNQLEGESKSSIQSQLLSGLAGVNKFVGNAVAKIPIVSERQIDEKIVETSERLDKFSLKRTDQTMAQLADSQSVEVRPFIDNIVTINKLYNKTTDLLFDGEYVYIDTL